MIYPYSATRSHSMTEAGELLLFLFQNSRFKTRSYYLYGCLTSLHFLGNYLVITAMKAVSL